MRRFLLRFFAAIFICLLVSCMSAPVPEPGKPAKASGSTDSAAVKGEESTPPSARDKDFEASTEKKASEGRVGEASSGTTAPRSETKPAPSLSPVPEKAKEAAKPLAARGESGLRAGFSDDNEQFNAYLDFLRNYESQVDMYPLKVDERILLGIKDEEGKSVPNAEIRVLSGGKLLVAGKTYANGNFALYPLELPQAEEYGIQVKKGDLSGSFSVLREGPRSITLKLQGKRQAVSPIPLDVLFILDTTGSMGEEIGRLKDTIAIIHDNLSLVSPRPELRFGMVLFKDRGKDEEYLTRIVPFTSDIETFRSALGKVGAKGGGDTPEDLQKALSDAMSGMEWRAEGVRLAFVITDAPPHLDYGQSSTYADAAREAKSRAIKIHTIGSGGLPLSGEYVLRQIAQYTDGRYIFLNYGEKGESSGGVPGSVSHHTGGNYQTDKLESIVIRFAKEELAFLSEAPLAQDESYFEATKIDAEEREATLFKLFSEAFENLADYAGIRIEKDTPCSLLPFVLAKGSEEALASQAEYFGEQALLSARKLGRFLLVERKDIQTILDELELQYSAISDDESASKIGRFVGAKVLVTGTLYRREASFELFLKLIRVETGEILSVTKARIDGKLGL